MNLNLESHFKPSCRLLKYQKEQGAAPQPSEPGTTSPPGARKPHPVTRGFLLPALIFPYLLLCRGCSVSAGRGSFHSLAIPVTLGSLCYRQPHMESPGMPRCRCASTGAVPATWRGCFYPLPEKEAPRQAAAEKSWVNPAGKRL